MEAYLKSLPIQKAISTLDQLLDKSVKSEAENPHGIIFIQDDGTETFESYPDLYVHVLQILGSLQDRGIQQGSYVIFQMTNNQSFIRLLWACILGGIIPVPLSVPKTASPDTEAFKRLIKVAEQLPQAHVIAEGAVLSDFQPLYNSENKFKYFSYEELSDSSSQGQRVTPGSCDTALILYTSGSTGDPKGIVLTHEHLAFNITQLNQRFNYRKDDIAGAWLPLTHTFGLTFFHLVPMLTGMSQFFMSSDSFVKKPWLYLQKICELNATAAASPNFGLEWMLDKTQESHLADIDLSKLRVIITGSEPISMDTIRRFYKKFSTYGLPDNTIYQVYGMSEACLGITIPVGGYNQSVLINRRQNRTGQNVEYVRVNDPNAAEFAVVGQPLNGMEVAVVDDNDKLLKENQIGNIVIKGPNVFDGYLHRTDTPFTKRGFLHTGDSGFISDGQLVIAGRKKDILFVNGQNYYASDIENTLLAALPQISQTAVCACHSQGAARDEIIVFARYRGKIESFAPVSRQIRDTVFARIGIGVDYVVPVKNIPKTTSGKIQRYRLTEQFENHEFDTLLEKISSHTAEKYTAPRTPGEKRVIEVLEKILSPAATESQRTVSATDRITDMGVNSLQITWLCNELEKITGVRLSLQEIFSLATPRHIAEKLEHAEADPSSNPVASPEIPRTAEAESHPKSSAQKRSYI
jgi:acyl-CoA synthetase (AMP-forming)/AMP-acid ligase II/acyl carrier protein